MKLGALVKRRLVVPLLFLCLGYFCWDTMESPISGAESSAAAQRTGKTIAVLVTGRDGVSATSALRDLLTAELSQHSGLKLVEREQIETILKEQETSQALSSSSDASLKLGRLAGADLLLCIEEGEQPRLRLVEAASGKILTDERLPKRDDVALTVAACRERLLANLGPRGEVPTIGVAAFENNSGTTRSNAFASELEKAVRRQLQQESDCTVLELQYPTQSHWGRTYAMDSCWRTRSASARVSPAARPTAARSRDRASPATETLNNVAKSVSNRLCRHSRLDPQRSGHSPKTPWQFARVHLHRQGQTAIFRHIPDRSIVHSAWV